MISPSTIFEILVMFLVTGCSTGSIEGYTQSKTEALMQQRLFVLDDGMRMPYRIYQPCGTNDQPIIFYFHGLGQNGTDNKSQLAYGANQIVQYAHEAAPMIVVAPQCPSDTMWWKIEDQVVEFINDVISHERVDTNRVYLTGYSMGGDLVWRIAISHPSIASTIVPICGGPQPGMSWERPVVPSGTASLNIWAINYHDDNVIDGKFSKCVMSEVWKHDLDHSFMQFFEKGGHTAEQYKNADLLNWIYSTRRTGTGN